MSGLHLVRRAFRSGSAGFNAESDPDAWMAKWPGKPARAELFALDNEQYLYLEVPADQSSGGKVTPGDRWQEMEEVFHTDGRLALSHKKVFVTGCFDLLHSGHVAFLQEASSFGDLFVGIGSDANVSKLKGRFPFTNEEERRFMLESVRYVYQCRINRICAAGGASNTRY
jgi:cytidyltransferase-like protein